MHFSLMFLGDVCSREVVWCDLVDFLAPFLLFSDVWVLVVCCGCGDFSLAVEHVRLLFSCRSSPSSSSKWVCGWVGCCLSEEAGVHHGHKNVSSVTGILSLSMQGL